MDDTTTTTAPQQQNQSNGRWPRSAVVAVALSLALNVILIFVSIAAAGDDTDGDAVGVATQPADQTVPLELTSPEAQQRLKNGEAARLSWLENSLLVSPARKWYIETDYTLNFGSSIQPDDGVLSLVKGKLHVQLPPPQPSDDWHTSRIPEDVDWENAQRWPLFIPGTPSSAKGLVEVSVTPAPGIGVEQYIYQRTLGQLPEGPTVYFDPQQVSRYAYSEPNVYYAESDVATGPKRTAVANASVTRGKSGFTACIPAKQGVQPTSDAPATSDVRLAVVRRDRC